MKNLQMEIAKAQATLSNLINLINNDLEVDTLGTLLTLQDQLNTIDEMVNK